jgi:Arc/MetJ-type ribon-helix-helix transcriptional regulator
MSLSDDLEAEIESAVSLGEYPSTEAVVADAIEQWRNLRRLDASLDVNELRRAWDQGLASGMGRGLSMDEIKSEARRRLASG